MNKPRLDKLRQAVIEQGGDWDTRRIRDLLGDWATQPRAWEMLDRLTTEGLLVNDGREWTAVEVPE